MRRRSARATFRPRRGPTCIARSGTPTYRRARDAGGRAARAVPCGASGAGARRPDAGGSLRRLPRLGALGARRQRARPSSPDRGERAGRARVGGAPSADQPALGDGAGSVGGGGFRGGAGPDAPRDRVARIERGQLQPGASPRPPCDAGRQTGHGVTCTARSRMVTGEKRVLAGVGWRRHLAESLASRRLVHDSIPHGYAQEARLGWRPVEASPGPESTRPAPAAAPASWCLWRSARGAAGRGARGQP